VHPTRASLNVPESKSQTASQSVQPFLHSSQQSVPIVPTMGRCFPSLEVASAHGGSKPSFNTWFNTWFLGPTQVLNPNGISINSALFSRARYCDRPRDRPSDHATRSVTIRRMYVSSTAMLPKNVKTQHFLFLIINCTRLGRIVLVPRHLRHHHHHHHCVACPVMEVAVPTSVLQV